MPDLNQERAHLALADRHIKETEGRIDEQIARITKSEAAGWDARQGHRFLAIMVDTLKLMHRHRRQILDALDEEESTMKQGKLPNL